MSSPFEYPPMDFDEDGKWDEGQQEGPVIHIPNDIKDIAVKHYRVEWLDVTEGEGSYSKNHMVATLIFTEAVTINGVKYKAARLSMELGSWKEVTSIIGQTGQERWNPGEQYQAGVYTLAMRKHKKPSHRALHYCTFLLREGTTIGHLTDMILERKMHHFVFLLYTREERWKGCGDHVLHCWALFVRTGAIATEQPIEAGALPLYDEIVYTYSQNGQKTLELIGRGRWVSDNPEEDELTPNTAYANYCLSHQLPRPIMPDDGTKREEVNAEEANDEKV